jgi:hypothetical protein
MGAQGGFHIRASLEVHLGSPLFAIKAIVITFLESKEKQTRVTKSVSKHVMFQRVIIFE